MFLSKYNGQSQIDSKGQLKHLLSIDGLNAKLIHEIFSQADALINPQEQSITKVPLLKNKTVANLFFEPSTRTKTTFELAAKRLSADVLTLSIQQSSTVKGETLIDTVNNLIAMQVDILVVRHPDAGTAHLIAKAIDNKSVSVVNAGDGCHAHPSQALLDMYTIKQHKKDFSSLTVAIVGDILHSRVARSNICALHLLGAHEIRVVGPKTLIPADIEQLGVRVYHQLQPGIQDADVIIMLRLQRERMQSPFLPSPHEFSQQYELTRAQLKSAKPDVLVMHPGPINRGIEIESAVADGAHSVILQQVHLGIAVRMSILATLAKSQNST